MFSDLTLFIILKKEIFLENNPLFQDIDNSKHFSQDTNSLKYFAHNFGSSKHFSQDTDSSKPVFYDTDCLTCFLIIDESSIFQTILSKMLGEMFSKIIIPRPVYEELFNESTPITIKDNLRSLIENGFVEVKDMSISSREYANYRCLETLKSN